LQGCSRERTLAERLRRDLATTTPFSHQPRAHAGSNGGIPHAHFDAFDPHALRVNGNVASLSATPGPQAKFLDCSARAYRVAGDFIRDRRIKN
jgi:hypothetical protein